MTTERLVFIRKALTTLATTGLLALGLATSALADPAVTQDSAPDLLTAVGSWEKGGHLANEAAVEGLAVAVRTDLLELGTQHLRFQDFGARSFEAELEKITHLVPGATTWIGRVAEFGEHSRVLLTTYEGAVSGYLDTPEARYEIVPRPGGHVMIKLDPSRFAGCGTEDGEHDHPLDAEARRDAASTLGLDAAALDVPAGDFTKSTAQIDLAVLYTQATKDQVGGTSAIVSTITSAVATLNDAFDASNINAQINLVGTEEAAKLGDTAGGGDGLALALFGNGSGLGKSNEQQLYENLPDLNGQSEAGDAFGEVLARGDFDNDGYDDLAVGVPGEDLSSGSIVDTGLVWIFYGSANGFDTASAHKFHQNSSGMADSNEGGDHFGFSLAVGDFDGDAYDDLAIGVPYETSRLDFSTGRVQILYGSSGGLSSTGSLSFEQDDLPGEESRAGDHFGWALASGDFDDDGYDDLAIGAPDKDVVDDFGIFGEIVRVSNVGQVAVVYGSPAGLDTNDRDLFDQDSSGLGNNVEPGDRFGSALAVGDFDDDGRDDLVIGVPEEDHSGTNSGLIHVLPGTASGLTGNGSDTFHQGLVGGSREDGDQFGFSLAVGDFDDDGISDLAVGAPYEDDGSNDAGQVNLLRGSSSGLSSAGVSITGSQASQYLGYALAAADFDGDLHDDLVVGQPGYDRNDGTNNEIEDCGRVQIYEGTSTGFGTGTAWAQFSGGIQGGPEQDDFFGAALAIGDFDDDGNPDLVAGVPGEGVSNESDYFKWWLGASDQVSTLRSSTNADLVGLIVEKLNDACGSAVSVLGTTAGNSSLFYQVTDRGCAVGNLTFAHEVGHLLGLAHDPANAGNSGACSDARGHFVDQEGRTLMSYDNRCTSNNCPRVALISDPGIDFDFGDPSGITNERDNARCARLTVGNIASYN